MARASENVRCRMLDELVDDASRSHRNRPAEQTKEEHLEQLVRRIASEMAVPQFNLGELIARLLSVVGPQIEERVREELQEMMRRQEQSYNDSFAG